MFSKVEFKVVVAFGLLAVVLVFLAVRFVPSTSASAPATGDRMAAARLAGSDWIERHRSVVNEVALYAGSDWIERHPSVINNTATDIGSDWIERHPAARMEAGALAGSDYIERHPSNRYDGSDWSERHP